MPLVWNRSCHPLCLGLKASVPPTRSGRSCSLSRVSCSPCQMGMVTLTWSWRGGCRRLWNTQYHVGHTEYLRTKIETPNVEILSFQIESDSQLLRICQDGAWFLGPGSWVLGWIWQAGPLPCGGNQPRWLWPKLWVTVDKSVLGGSREGLCPASGWEPRAGLRCMEVLNLLSQASHPVYNPGQGGIQGWAWPTCRDSCELQESKVPSRNDGDKGSASCCFFRHFRQREVGKT